MGKRLFDFFGALLFFVIALPCVPLIALWIKMTSPGPIFFFQKRIGLRGRPFTMLKFRTMTHGSGRPLDLVLPGDSRVTTSGKFLRKTHMDELPQLINVLLGQMSLVGPRPNAPEIVERRIQEIPQYARCLDIRPGLTGLVQTYGRIWSIRHGTRGVLRANLFYLEHYCLWLDLCIVFRTIEVVVRGKGI